MTSATTATLERPRRRGRTRSIALSRLRPRPELAGLLALAAILNLWALGSNGWANEYYSAAVRSMASSWHDFLYASFDSSGVMTVDKPPLALWVQVASVKVFGFNSLAILVPQALMGVASVALVYDLTRRRFGRLGGFVAGLALAVTPMTVAISRHNNPDALLVLCCVAALWLVVRGLEDGRTRWLVLAGVCVGLGFETKMAAALMIVPALAAAWLWVAPRGRVAAVRQVLAGGAAMAVAGGAWPLLVALTPASGRPWVSGTGDNSILSLILGYNGVGRLAGQAGGPQAMGGGPGGGTGGGPFGGPTGVLRLLDSTLGGQAGWLVGLAVVGGVGILVASRLRRRDPRTGWLIATGGSFLACAVAFSFAEGIFHPYYVAQLAPFTAALVGATVGAAAAGDRFGRMLAPVAVLGGVASELVVLHNNPEQLTWLAPVLAVVGVLAAAALAVRGSARLRVAVLAVALVVLLLAPATWAAQTLGHATSGTFPSGGPASASAGGGPGGPGGGFARRGGGTGPGAFGGGGAPPGAGGLPGGGQAGGRGGPGGGMFGGNQQLSGVLRYTRAHGGGTVGVSSQSGASSSIIGSGADVAALGGFSGRESEVSVSWLAEAVRDGRIRWVLTDGSRGGGLPGDTRAGSSDVMTAVAKTCKRISSSAYSSGSSSAGGALYDCQGMADALLRAG
jgi:4-amino-4-deoxy-L-arabinose transferase-like glycosyltransferase